MRVHQLRTHHKADTAEVSATVEWEDCDRQPLDIYIRTAGHDGEDLAPSPNAFLQAAILPAIRYGEKRISVEGDICPCLRDGLISATAILRAWHGPPRAPIAIEPTGTFRPAEPRQPARTGAFYSGGVDSTALLRINHLELPPGHPLFIHECLFVYGFDIGVRRDEHGVYDRALARLSHVAGAAGAKLLAVETNIRQLDSDVGFWCWEYHGMAMAAIAESFARRFTTVMLAASGTAARAVVDRWGSHPLIDACYGSAAVDFRHEGICYSRVDKLHVLAQWPVALDNLRVCTKNFMPGDELGYADLPLGEYNCGRCEKCIRTMLDLLLIGKLAASDAFPYDDLTPDALEPLRVRQAWLADKYEQTMIPPLRSMGRDDIADALQRKIGQFCFQPHEYTPGSSK